MNVAARGTWFLAACLIALVAPGRAGADTINVVVIGSATDLGPEDGNFDSFVPTDPGCLNNNGYTSLGTAFEFDLSAIPAGSTIQSATLSIVINSFIEGTRRLALHGYAGNGTLDFADFGRSDDLLLDATIVNGASFAPIDIAAFLQELVDDHAPFAGVNVREEPPNQSNFGVFRMVTTGAIAPKITLTFTTPVGPTRSDLVELGTLGGTSSVAFAANDSGMIVGHSLIAGDASEHAFLHDGFLDDGIMVDLGTLGGSYSYAFGINASGMVFGDSTTAGEAAVHPFLYDGTMHDLGTLGGAYAYSAGINASGAVVGYSYTGVGGAFHAFLYEGGTMHDLGTLGGGNSYAKGINDDGKVAGVSAISSENDFVRAFLYYDDVMHDLGTLGGNYSFARGINASGEVFGVAYTAGDSVYHAFLYDGAMHDLGTLGGRSSDATAMNASGTVVGSSYTAGDSFQHAFLYDGSMHDLGTLGGTESFATAINDAGVVVGYSKTADDAETHIFLYDGTMHDLGSLGGGYGTPLGINSSGVVVGQSNTSVGLGRAFVSIPGGLANHVPVTRADAYFAEADTELVVGAPGVLENDLELEGDSMSASLLSGPSHGALDLESNGSFTYTPDSGYVGADSFTYVVSDGNGLERSATAAITVDHAPVWAPIADRTVDEFKRLTFVVTATDPDSGDQLTYGVIGLPDGANFNANTRTFRWTPSKSQDGVHHLIFTVSDGKTISNETCTIRVREVNQAPVFTVSESVRVDEGALLTFTSATDRDTIEGYPQALTHGVTGLPSGATFDTASGAFAWTPERGDRGSYPLVFSVSDGVAPTIQKTVSITVIGVPVAVDDEYTTTEDTALNVAAPGLLGNDLAIGTGQPTGAVVAVKPKHGTVVLATNKSFKYTPFKNFSGTDSFTYKAKDGTVLSAEARVTITVTPVNDAPTVKPDKYQVNEGGTLVVDAQGVLANDTDAEGSSLSAQLSSGTTKGQLTLNADGSFTYTNSAAAASDKFKYKATDGTAASAAALVTIVVNRRPVPRVSTPATIPDSGGDGEEVVSLNGSTTTDPDGASSLPLVFEWFEGSTPIATGITANVTLTTGAHSLTLTVTDKKGASASLDFSVEVTP